jgi:L-2-hydroxyglutarate oxidase LhgO
VKTGAIATPQSFIEPVPHMSFVRGADDVAFLKKRYEPDAGTNESGTPDFKTT